MMDAWDVWATMVDDFVDWVVTSVVDIFRFLG